MVNALKQATLSAFTRVGMDCDPRDTIVVAGAPRSGTTWLAEILRTLPSYKLMNEPLFLPNHEAARTTGFDWRTHIAPGEEAPRAREFFEDVLSGRVPHGPLWHYQANSSVGRLIEQATRRKLVVKFCRSGRLLRWLLEEFEIRGAVMIIRHPCAVLASQLEHGGWDTDQLEREIESDEALGQMPNSVRHRFADVLEGISTRLGLMAAVWCLDYYIPFVEHDEETGTPPWILVSYEQMVLDGAKEVERILSYVNADVTAEIQNQIDVASTYASADLVTNDRERQLSKWRRRLTEQQINRVLEIVSAFGLDFYDERLIPDLSKQERKAFGLESTSPSSK